MSLPPAAMLAALGMAQLQTVAPELEGTYPGGTASTLGLCLILLAQDAASAPARRSNEEAAMHALLAEAGEPAEGPHEELLVRIEALHARIDGDPAQQDLNLRLLGFLAAMADAAFVAPPPMG